jgi:hypothetical protein
MLAGPKPSLCEVLTQAIDWYEKRNPTPVFKRLNTALAPHEVSLVKLANSLLRLHSAYIAKGINAGDASPLSAAYACVCTLMAHRRGTA